MSPSDDRGTSGIINAGWKSSSRDWPTPSACSGTSTRRLLEVVGLTLQVTLGALAIALLLGIPAGAAVGLARRLPGRAVLVPIIYTGMGLPPVVVGLFAYLLLSNQGPLGSLGWLFTPTGMVLAQTIIALPLVVGLTMTAVQSVDPQLRAQLQSLGATRRQVALTILAEARIGVTAAVVAAYGSIISEVGAVMLVGGNIEGETRVLTTAIVLETRRGNFALALALGDHPPRPGLPHQLRLLPAPGPPGGRVSTRLRADRSAALLRQPLRGRRARPAGQARVRSSGSSAQAGRARAPCSGC